MPRNPSTPTALAFVILASIAFALIATAGTSSDLTVDPVFLSAPSLPSGAANANSAAHADFNGDTFMDIVVVNESGSGRGSVSVLMGNGDGSFQSAVSYPVGGSADSVVAADFNHDGKADLAIASKCANAACNTGDVSVLLNQGDGTFQPSVNYATQYQSLSVALGDFNHDGSLDLAVANQCESSACANGTVSVLLGNADGTFQPAVSFATQFKSQSVAVGDFNRDGKPDLAVANFCANGPCNHGSVSVLLGNGDGTFAPAVNYATQVGSDSIAAGDFNGDHKPDLAVLNYCATGLCKGASVSVLLGNGDGTFQTAVNYAAGRFGFSITSVDFNADGKPDLAVTNGCADSACTTNTGSVNVLLGKGDGTFRAAGTYPTQSFGSHALTTADFNRDSKIDLAVANNCADGACSASSVSLFSGNGDGTFQGGQGFEVKSSLASSVAVGDFNADGKLDAVVANDGQGAQGSISVLLGNGDGTLQAPVNIASQGPSSHGVAVADFNADGNADVVLTNQCGGGSCNGGSVTVFLGKGNGTFRSPASYPTQPKSFSVVVGDFNGDGKPDLAVANQCVNNACATGSVTVLFGRGNGQFQRGTSYPAQFKSFFVAAGDFNGDGKPDLAVANQCGDSSCVSGSVSILVNNGDGTFQAAVSYPAQLNSDYVAVADFNADGKPDLAVVNQCVDTTCTAGSVSLFLGNGDGTFQAATNYPVEGSAQSLVTGDFNGDGHADLAVGLRNNSNLDLLLGNGDGTFQPATGYSASPAYGLALGDFDNDGKPDLAMVNGSSSIVMVRNITAAFRYATTSAVAASANPIMLGQSVTFTATVTPAFNAGAPTGTVSFFSKTNLLGSAPLSGNQASLAVTFTQPGSRTVTAVYSGDTTYLGSTSPALDELVNKADSTTALTSTPNPSLLNQSVTFTATVNSSLGIPPNGEIVAFQDGDTTIGTAALSVGVARFTSSSLTVGDHAMRAVYAGDARLKSSSGTMTQTINSGSKSR